jgi:hypothetical protein
MNARVTMALVCAAVCFATTVSGQQAVAKPNGTNTVTVLSVETNVIAVVRGRETNFVLEVREQRSDGWVRVKSSRIPPADIGRYKLTQRIERPAWDGNSPFLRYYWPPGEYRDEMFQQRRPGAVFILRPRVDGNLHREDRYIGDFWLPGEFEKMLEEKRQQRRQQGK